MIVVDLNVIAYLLIRGARSEVMDRLLLAEPDWIAPRLWLDEFVNVLCTYDRLLAVARRTGCSGYGSQYIALAEDPGLKLYTCDTGLFSRCPEVAVMPQ